MLKFDEYVITPGNKGHDSVFKLDKGLRLLKSHPLFLSLEPFGRSGLLRKLGNGKGHGNQSGLEL